MKSITDAERKRLAIENAQEITSIVLQEDQHLVTQLNQVLEIGSKVDIESAAKRGGLVVYRFASCIVTHAKLSEMGPDRRMLEINLERRMSFPMNVYY